MRLRERVTIRASCEEVWRWIADPDQIARWNPKLVAIDRGGGGPLRLGERFDAVYRMKGRDRETSCEVVEVREPDLLIIRNRPMPDRPAGAYVDECYRLRPARQGTRLVQEIDFTHSGVPWFFQLLMWLIHSTGEAVGKRYLVTLKELVEDDTMDASAS